MKAALCIEELSRCWRHMLACALLTEELARSCRRSRRSRLYRRAAARCRTSGLVAGLSHRVCRLLRNAGRNALELLDCERETLGMDHCEAGRLLAGHWNLPPDFPDCRRPPSRSRKPTPQVDLLTLVHLGCKLADSLGFWVVEPSAAVLARRRFKQSLPPLLAKRFTDRRRTAGARLWSAASAATGTRTARRWRTYGRIRARLRRARTARGRTGQAAPARPQCAAIAAPRARQIGDYRAVLHHRDRGAGLFRGEVRRLRQRTKRAFGKAFRLASEGMIEAGPVVFPGNRGGQLHQLSVVEARPQGVEQSVGQLRPAWPSSRPHIARPTSRFR